MGDDDNDDDDYYYYNYYYHYCLQYTRMDALILKVHRAQSVAYVLLRNIRLYIKERFIVHEPGP